MGTQIFDALYAYLQSLDSDNYRSMIEMTVDAPYQADDLNILFDNLPYECSEQELTKYDFVFFCNNVEPLQVSTKTMGDFIDQKNVYLLINSYLTESHPLFNKAVGYPGTFMLCRDYWTRHVYPHFFENIKNRSIVRKEELIAINGADRTNRHYFFNLLQQHVPSIPRLSRLGTAIYKLKTSQWESIEDTQFRNLVNNKFGDISIRESNQLHDSNLTIGIEGKYGKTFPGFSIMPEYFAYSCVIFPETTWQNNELAINEKAMKCFYAGSLPFPIGGSNTNQLYTDIGFYTAWHLLPDNLKNFDQITDHDKRYQQAIVAIDWLNANRKVFNSDRFKSMIDQNRSNFFTCACEYISVKKFYDLIKTKLNIDLCSKI